MLIALIATACAAQAASEETPQALTAVPSQPAKVSETPAVEPTTFPKPSPTVLDPTPLLTEEAAAILPPEPPTPFSATGFASFPGNLARNEKAPEFTARLLGGERFALSEWQGGYLLMVPTVVGCGDCLFSMQEIAMARENHPAPNVQVLLLDVYSDDHPQVWQDYADFFADFEFLWGVVDSPEFVLDYEIESLGPFILISPEGQIVFRSYFPLPRQQIQVLLELTEGADSNSSGDVE